MPKGNVKGCKKHKRNKNYTSEKQVSKTQRNKVKNMRKLQDAKVTVVLM